MRITPKPGKLTFERLSMCLTIRRAFYPTKQVVGCITNDTCRQQVSCTISVAINEARIASKPNIIRLFFVSDCRLLQWSITSQSWKRIGQNDDKSVTYIQGNFNEVRTTKIYPYVYSHIHVSIPMHSRYLRESLWYKFTYFLRKKYI